MPKTRKIRIIVVLFGIALAGFVFVTTIVHATNQSDIEDITFSKKGALEAAEEYPSAPLRLLVPSVNIDAAVQKVGLSKKGNMAVPTNFTDAGWYKYGTLPGAQGSAVIDGHVDNALSLDGVFKHLNDVNIGDSVFVYNENGEKLEFIVIKKEMYSKSDVPMEEIFNKTGGSYLNIITCAGDWVQADKNYDHRLVVYTELKK